MCGGRWDFYIVLSRWFILPQHSSYFHPWVWHTSHCVYIPGKNLPGTCLKLRNIPSVISTSYTREIEGKPNVGVKAKGPISFLVWNSPLCIDDGHRDKMAKRANSLKKRLFCFRLVFQNFVSNSRLRWKIEFPIKTCLGALCWNYVMDRSGGIQEEYLTGNNSRLPHVLPAKVIWDLTLLECLINWFKDSKDSRIQGFHFSRIRGI